MDAPPFAKAPPKFIKKLNFEKPNEVEASGTLSDARAFYKPVKYKPKKSSRNNSEVNPGSQRGDIHNQNIDLNDRRFEPAILPNSQSKAEINENKSQAKLKMVSSYSIESVH